MNNGHPAYDFDTLFTRHNIGASKWRKMQTDGRQDFAPDIFPFSIADMEFKTAPEILDALHREADFGIFGYMKPTDRYYDAVCSWLQRRHQYLAKPEWIVQTPGVVYALFQIVQAFSSPGEGVIVQTPVYYPFYRAIESHRRQVIRNPLQIVNGRYEMDLEDLARKAADPNTRLMILCSPHNPVGRVWKASELLAVAKICLENKVLLISDEIHFDIVFPQFRHTVLAGLDPEIAENSIICTSPSKTFNLAGLSTSNLIIPNDELRKTFSQAVALSGLNSTNHFGTMACQAAYESGEAWYFSLMDYLAGNLRRFLAFMQDSLPDLTVYPTEGTYLSWFDARPLGLGHLELERYFRARDIFFDEGYLFGEDGAGFERINLALPRAALEAGLKRLKSAVDELREGKTI